MASKLRDFVKRCTPPILVDVLRGSSRAPKAPNNESSQGSGSEQAAEWYDRSFERAEHWREPYTTSRYYFFWSVIVDRLVRDGKDGILDIGCGPGQFASLARDRGVKRYWGLDFSEKRIEQARKVCPEFPFFMEDAFLTDKFNTLDYQVVVMTEVLEHVENDIGLLQRIKPGSRVLGSVPNFPYKSHVRHFKSAAEVEHRYKPVFTSLQVDEFIANSTGHRYFLLDGVKR